MNYTFIKRVAYGTSLSWLLLFNPALFRYKPYHSSDDTPGKLDYESLARVISGLEHVIAELAGTTSMS